MKTYDAKAESFRELLLGCGHSRVKKLASVDGNPNWRGLATLDKNTDCRPDWICDLDHVRAVGNHFILTPCATSEQPDSDITLSFGFTRATFCEDIFDEVHAYEVLEHLGHQGNYESFFAIFTEIWRILKPDGHLYATVPSRFSPWLWGDPSHRRAILPESLVFLDQNEYIRQLDGPTRTAMSDFRFTYKADFKIIRAQDDRHQFAFVLQAVKPSRWKVRDGA